MKTCSKCDTTLAESEFYGRKGSPDGLRNECKSCWRTMTRINTDRRERADPVRHRAAKRRQIVRRAYGLTVCDLTRQRITQGDKCAVCGSSDPVRGTTWHIDHDHACCPGKRSCGKCVRGLLCYSCNVGLGIMRDNVEALASAINYLESGGAWNRTA